MLFYTPAPQDRNFTSGVSEGKADYTLDYGRVVVGVVLLLAIIIAAFIANYQEWQEGASAFLHLTEVVAGGLFGLVIGEGNVVRSES